MIRVVLLFIWFPLFALELSIQSGKESSEPYSILHLRDKHPFNCSVHKNDFNQIDKIECSITSTRPLPKINNLHFVLTQTPTSIIVTPKTKIALYPVGYDLKYAPTLYGAENKKINHWNIIGYVNKIPMVHTEKSSSNQLNIPIKVSKNTLPSVGGLDLKGNPIKIKNVQDVNGYMDLKKAYDKKDYSKVIFLAKSIQKDYPNTIFSNELMLYQIRSFHHLGKNEELIAMSKPFIRQFSSDQNIPEVLAYTANAYSQLGQNADSDYFYDRLFTEHQDDPFASKGMYFKAKHLEVQGSPSQAARYYREALSRTKDVHLASACAFELAQMEFAGKDPKKGREYIDKIARVYPKYFTEVHSESKDMIQVLEAHKDYISAAKITQSLIAGVPDKSQEHGELLKEVGSLYAQAGKKKEALEALNSYLKLFPYGDFRVEVQRIKDSLFFEKDENNGSKGVKKYDELIERYGNDSIGNKALYKKAQLLYQQGKYEDILKVENDLYKLDTTAYPDASGLITKSATEITKRNLKEGKCNDVMSMNKMYKIQLPAAWDALSFECALKNGNFKMAKELVAKNIKSKELSAKQRWLYRAIKTNYALGEYKEALRGGKELTTLLDVQKNPPLNDVYRLLFDSAQRSNNGEQMIQTIKQIETMFGQEYKDIERYTQMMTLGLQRKDEAMVQNYGNKVIALQKRTNTMTQSPFVEFTMAQSLMNQNKNKEALGVLKALDKIKLSGEKRSRQYYLMGSISMTLGNNTEAKNSFNASMKADKNSAWAKLAKDALGLL